MTTDNIIEVTTQQMIDLIHGVSITVNGQLLSKGDSKPLMVCDSSGIIANRPCRRSNHSKVRSVVGVVSWMEKVSIVCGDVTVFTKNNMDEACLDMIKTYLIEKLCHDIDTTSFLVVNEEHAVLLRKCKILRNGSLDLKSEIKAKFIRNHEKSREDQIKFLIQRHPHGVQILNGPITSTETMILNPDDIQSILRRPGQIETEQFDLE
jgi:hypothetical protein